MIPKPLEQLIKQFSKLPGLGPRSAQRAVLHMLSKPESMENLQSALQQVATHIKTCETCGNVGLESPCHVCTDTRRDTTVLCVVEGVDDLWAIDRSGSFKGQFHVLGGVVSALDGVSPEDLRINQLTRRVEEGEIQEVILALGASVEGQTTSHLVAQRLKNMGVDVSTLAKGIPVGAEVDYLDEGTLSLALRGRISF